MDTRHPILELDIVDLAHDGRGVARAGDKAVFVSGALPGERVRARVLKRHRQYDDAELAEVLQASADRVEPRCAHASVCSGCSLQHLAPAAQIAAKESQLLAALERIGRVRPERVLPPLQRDLWAYRRKGRLSVRHVAKKGRVLVGFREDNGRYVADIQRCEVLDARVGGLVAALAELIGGLSVREALPQIEVAAAERVVLVLRVMAPLTAADRQGLQAFAVQQGVEFVLQPAGIDSLVALDGGELPTLHYRVDGDIDIAYRPLDFVQVNDSINQAMVQQALDHLQAGPGDRVLDLYCGLGNFTLPIARRVASVVGVEGDAGLLERAAANARATGLHNTAFHVADLSQDQRLAAWAAGDYTRILLDPPRAGAEAVFAYLPGKAVERIVYVSCHPATLARDAALLCGDGRFVLRAAGVMDMFPHTAHVESMAVFERN